MGDERLCCNRLSDINIRSSVGEMGEMGGFPNASRQRQEDIYKAIF